MNITWPKGTITVEMSPRTLFCLDLRHTDPDGKPCHLHHDEGSPGDVITCSWEEFGKEPQGCGKQFRLGSTIHLVPWPFEGSIPACTKLAWVKDGQRTTSRREVVLLDGSTTPLKRWEDPDAVNDNFKRRWDWQQQFTAYADHEDRAAHATCQWKGTEADYEFTCGCGYDLVVEQQWFVYQVMCPVCERIYVAIDDIPVEEITP
jgi:hypothetical protein